MRAISTILCIPIATGYPTGRYNPSHTEYVFRFYIVLDVAQYPHQNKKRVLFSDCEAGGREYSRSVHLEALQHSLHQPRHQAGQQTQTLLFMLAVVLQAWSALIEFLKTKSKVGPILLL